MGVELSNSPLLVGFSRAPFTVPAFYIITGIRHQKKSHISLSACDLKNALEWFTTTWEARMRANTESIFPHWKIIDCFHLVGYILYIYLTPIRL